MGRPNPSESTQLGDCVAGVPTWVPLNLLFGILGAKPVSSDMVPMEGISPINILLNRVPQTFIFSLDILYQGIMDSVPLMICWSVSPFFFCCFF